jgi:hypothetical protein
MSPGVNWLGAAIVAVPLLGVALAAWAGLRHQSRETRMLAGNPAMAEALRAAKRRHPAKGRPGGHERLRRGERQAFEPQFRRIAEALEAEMAETEGDR